MKKMSEGRAFWLVILAIFIGVQTLNFTGFCYSEGRFFNEDQIYQRLAAKRLKRYNPNATDEQIEAMVQSGSQLAHIWVHAYTPFNNNVYEGTAQTILNRIFGRYFYYVSIISEEDEAYKSRSQRFGRESVFFVDACGNNPISSYGDGFTKEKYFKELESRRKAALHDAKMKSNH